MAWVVTVIIVYCGLCKGFCWPWVGLLPSSLFTVVSVRVSVGHGLGCYRHHCLLWLV